MLSGTRVLNLFTILVDPEELKEYNDNSIRTEPQRLLAQWSEGALLAPDSKSGNFNPALGHLVLQVRTVFLHVSDTSTYKAQKTSPYRASLAQL